MLACAGCCHFFAVDVLMEYPRIYVAPDEAQGAADTSQARSALRPVHWKRVEVRPLIEDVLDALSSRLENQTVRAEVDVPPAHIAWADGEMLRRCVLGLTLHALDAMPEGGELFVTSHVGPHGFELEIADSGRADSESFRATAREAIPVGTSKIHGGEVALAHRLAAAHGGEITARNCPDGGTARTIRIPHRALEAAA
jgi:two-component system sensor histidine kinase HydH